LKVDKTKGGKNISLFKNNIRACGEAYIQYIKYDIAVCKALMV